MPAPTRARAGVTPRVAPTSVLDATASEAPFDTVVVVMMENRSFDHLLGWAGTDAAYLDAGRRRYGGDFAIDGSQKQTYTDAQGQPVATHWLPGTAGERFPYQGCGENIPGHGWNAGRVQMKDGFLAKGSGNGPFSLGYYDAADMLFTEQLVRRFTTADRWFSSLLGPTFPNRQYLHAAQSARQKHDPGPLKPGMFGTRTIWDNLLDAKVPAAYYYTDLPIATLWGERLYDITHSLEHYFDDASQGKLANVVMVDPGFQFAQRTDDHPVGDIRAGQRWLRVDLPGVRAVTAVEHRCLRRALRRVGWVLRPREAAARAGRAVERPTAGSSSSASACPRSSRRRSRAPGTPTTPSTTTRRCSGCSSGASSARPPRAPLGGADGRWWLTGRDRHAANLGATFAAEHQGDLGFDPGMDLPAPADPCTFGAKGGTSDDGDPFNSSQQMSDLQDSRFKEASPKLWSQEA